MFHGATYPVAVKPDPRDERSRPRWDAVAMINVQRIGNDEPARLKPIAGPSAAKVSLAQGGAGVD
jgi:hypothetical protein